MEMPRTRKAMVKAAQEEFTEEGRVEIDDNAKVSFDKTNPDNGAYVAA